MSKVKEWTAKIHLGVLELTVLIFIVLIWSAGFYEAHFLSKLQSKINNEIPTWWDFMANSMPVILGSLSAMSLPPFIQNAKSKTSWSGAEISPLELLIIIGLVSMTFLAPFWLYIKCEEAVTLCTEIKVNKIPLLTPEQAKLRLDTITGTILLNVLTDVLLGLWSIYEVAKAEDNIKIISYGKARKRKKEKEILEKEEKKEKEQEEKQEKEEKKHSLVPLKK